MHQKRLIFVLRYSIACVLFITLTLAGEVSAFWGKSKEIPKGNYAQDVNGKYEYIAVSPSGKLSPIFSSHDKCAAYTMKHSKKFGEATVIHRRLKK